MRVNSPNGSLYSVVLHGYIQGPPVFNIVINWAAQLAETNKTVSQRLVLREGGATEDDWVLDLDYADDLSVLDGTEEGIHRHVAHFAGYAGLKDQRQEN